MSLSDADFLHFRTELQHVGDMAQPTEMPDQERVARAKEVFMESLDARRAVHLESCIHCGLCAEACHFYISTQDPKYTPIRKLELIRRFYRRELSPNRWLYRLVSRDLTAQDLEDWQELVYDSCTECGRCSLICPMGIHIADMVAVTREALAQAGLIPAELRGIAQEQAARGSVFGVDAQRLLARFDELKEMGLEVPVNKDKAEVMVLTSVLDVMLTRDALVATVKIMNHLGVDWTVRTEGFECANFGMLSGHAETQWIASKRIVDAAIACDAKVVITAECGHAYPAMRWDAANFYGKPLPFEVMAISEFLGRELEAGRLKLKEIENAVPMTFHDPCKLGRIGGTFDGAREVLKDLGIELREMASNREMNLCCGGGAGVFLLNRATPLREKVFELKRQQVNETGAEKVVVTCGSCRLNYLSGKVHTHWDKDIVSLVEMVGDNLADGGAQA